MEITFRFTSTSDPHQTRTLPAPYAYRTKEHLRCQDRNRARPVATIAQMVRLSAPLVMGCRPSLACRLQWSQYPERCHVHLRRVVAKAWQTDTWDSLYRCHGLSMCKLAPLVMGWGEVWVYCSSTYSGAWRQIRMLQNVTSGGCCRSASGCTGPSCLRESRTIPLLRGSYGTWRGC